MTRSAARPLLVFADDWGRHPSSCQHLIRHLMPRRDVVWVNTIGTRPPRLDWGTVKRVAGKLREWVRANPERERRGRKRNELESYPVAHAPGSPQPRVVAPKMWPSFKSRLARRLNRALLLRALTPVVERLPQPPVVITTLPLVADLVGRLPVHGWVYYCVDDFSVWPGYDGATMLRMERDLVPKMDCVIAVSDTLVKHLATFGKSAHLLTHGVDLDHWRRPTTPPPEFANLTPPFVVFWGVIDRRMDLAFVRHLSANLSAGTIVLVGPREDPDPELLRLPRVTVLPPIAYERLPDIAAATSVLMMPYIDAPVTHAMQPLKLKEYIATGKPAVVRSLPSTKLWDDCVDLAETPEAFTQLVNARLANGLPEEQRQARTRLEAEGWAEKAIQLEYWVNSVNSLPTR